MPRAAVLNIGNIGAAIGLGSKTRPEIADVKGGSGGAATARVAIIGTGLIGTSIALGLKAKGPRGLEIVGTDRSRENVREAQQMKAIDRIEPSLARAVDGASLVIIATPILSIREVMEDIAGYLEPGAVVTDTGSTKAEIMRWASMLLPKHAAFIGGHPMAGKTEAGPGAAEATLFEGARWVVTASRQAPKGAIELILGLARTLGATPQFMDPEEHDAYVAAVSHLPLMAATALFQLARSSEAWPEMSLLAAGGFKDTTRLAGTDSAMAHDIAITNRKQIAHWLQRYREALQALETEILDIEHESELFRALSQANLQYAAFSQGIVGRKEVHEDLVANLPESGGMMDMLIGGALAERARELQKRSEERLEESERDFRAGGRG
jgi:prephenate dehydrogenase